MLTGSQIVALHETTLDWCLVALGKTQLDIASEIAAELLKLSTQPQLCLKAASHRIRYRLMANGSLHTGSVARIRVNFLGFDRLPAYLKLV